MYTYLVLCTNASSTTSNHVVLNNLLEKIGIALTIRDLGSIIVTCLVFIFTMIFFRIAVNKTSNQQLSIFINNRKYIPELYTELNENMENLRYFIYSTRWKNRVIREYNKMFSDRLGKEIVKKIGIEQFNKKLSYFSSVDTIMNAIEERKSILETLKNDRSENYRKFGEYQHFLYEYIYYLPDYLNELYQFCEMMKSKSTIIVGSAGNGKTTILCRLVETIIANKMPCLFLNAKDITGDCSNYIFKIIGVPFSIPVTKLLLHFLSINLYIGRKYFFIIIDAINENDSKEFIASLGQLTSTFSKFSRIKIIFSCRSEYFEIRYQNLFNEHPLPPYIFRLKQVNYSEKAKHQLITLYKSYYNVNTPLSINTVERLMHSLFLMRIFFEVNENKEYNNLNLCNASIYSEYLDKIKKATTPFDFPKIIEKTVSLMVSNLNFDKIKIDDLNLSTDDTIRFKNALDDNLVISTTIQEGHDIATQSTEYVYFVFDELRDYCIARYIIILDEQNNDDTYSETLKLLSIMHDNHMAPTEGVLKYVYYYLRKSKKVRLCEHILKTYSDYSMYNFNFNNQRESNYRDFKDLGLTLIFQDATDLQSFETNYIAECITRKNNSFWELLSFLLRNEAVGLLPNTNLAIDIFSEKLPFSVQQKIVSDFFSDRYSKYYSHSQKRSIEYLCDSINYLEKNSTLSLSVKELVIILASIEPYEPVLWRLNHLSSDKEAITHLLSKNINEELRTAITEFSKPSSANDLFFFDTEDSSIALIWGE